MVDKEIVSYHQMDDAAKTQYVSVQLTLLSDYSTAMRERSQPEYLFTAAGIGSFGAVAWGVAAIDPTKYIDRYFLFQPAYVAAAGILIGCIAVITKIIRENRRYMNFRAKRAEIAQNLYSIDDNLFRVPAELLSAGHGRGHMYSSAIIITFAIAASMFCICVVRGA